MSSTGSGKPLRLLAPAPTPDRGTSSSGSGGGSVPSKNIMPRRTLVKNACRNCQAKKTKCDGKRPRCSRCTSRNSECVYDSLYEGMTKQQSSEHEIHRLQVALAEFNQQFHALRHGTGDEAQAMLTIIRQYAQVDGLGDGTQSKSVSGSVTSFSPSPADSEASTEYDFLPFLFDRHDWTRQPSPNLDQGSLDPSSAQRSPADELLDNGPYFGPRDETQQPQRPNGFGNLPFSSGILTNHYPSEVQEQQHNNVFRPLWAILPLTTLPGPSSVKESVASTLRQARLLVHSGQSIEQVIGRKCNIAAIYDRNQYLRATLVSQWAAGLTYSLQLRNREFVAYASMHVAWTVARWMIDPRPDTYEAIPEWLRPTMIQLWTPHVELVDFFIWPALRDTIVNNPLTLQRDWRWLEDMSRTIDCEWFLSPELALETDVLTGEVHLSEAAEACAEQLANWSVASSARQYMEDVDSIVRVRSSAQYSFN